MIAQTLVTLMAAAPAVLARPHIPAADPKCTIVFDGRVPVGTAATTFDTSANGIFNADYVKGGDLKWSDILKFPNISSRFDGTKHTALEVTISDKSIFQKQVGFRRAGLQFLKDAADGDGAKGVKTLHFSVKQDAARPLNLTHEYLNVWHETADYSADQIQFTTGSTIGKANPTDKADFRFIDRSGSLLWSVPIDHKEWQNFAVTLDWSKNLTSIYYSSGAAELKVVAANKTINLAGGGQFQFGILKKPIGGGTDPANSGTQPSNLNEGQIYGGVFLEDSASGCVSL